MDGDVLDSWEDAADIGEFEKRMDEREKNILAQEELQRQAMPKAPNCTNILPQEETGRSEYVPQIKILKRQNGAASQKTQQKTVKPIKTLAQKEADYAAARARILGDYSNASTEEDSRKIILATDSTATSEKTQNSMLRTDSPKERLKR